MGEKKDIYISKYRSKIRFVGEETYLSRSVEPVRLYDETNSHLTSRAGDAPSSSFRGLFTNPCTPYPDNNRR